MPTVHLLKVTRFSIDPPTPLNGRLICELAARQLKHGPEPEVRVSENWKPVFGNDHAQTRVGRATWRFRRSGQRLVRIGLLEAVEDRIAVLDERVEAFLDADLVGKDRLHLRTELRADLGEVTQADAAGDFGRL